MGTAGNSRALLEGKALHPMCIVAIDQEATSFHNKIRQQSERVEQANRHCADLIAEFRLAVKAPSDGPPGTWRADDNDGMHYPEAADLVGGETDC